MIDHHQFSVAARRPRLVCAVDDAWRARYGPKMARWGVDAQFVDGGDALARSLARDWSVDAVILDLDAASASLAGRFGPGGPRLIAFGEPANAGIALAARRVHFIEPDEDENSILALLRAGGPEQAGVADLSDRSLARREARDAETQRVVAALTRLVATTAAAPSVEAEAVRQVIRARHARGRFFPADMFGDPAWDMLLDLFAASIEGTVVSVTSLCIAATVPTSTALRWIRKLCDAGIFDRQDDPADARRAHVSLTPASLKSMRAYFAAINRSIAA